MGSLKRHVIRLLSSPPLPTPETLPTSSSSSNSSRRRSLRLRTLARVAASRNDSSDKKTEAELTTEKYGLEAGLWKVLTGGATKDGGDGTPPPSSSPPSASASPPAPPPSSLSRTDQAKALLKTYGSAYLLTSISFALVSFGACYALVNAGVDVGGLVEKLPAALGGGARPGAAGERVGAFAIAYAAHKALSPVRFPPTVALTPVVARWLGKKPSSSEEGEETK